MSHANDLSVSISKRLSTVSHRKMTSRDVHGLFLNVLGVVSQTGSGGGGIVGGARGGGLCDTWSDVGCASDPGTHSLWLLQGLN